MRKTNTAMFTKYQTIFLSKSLKQTKAGPRSSGTPFLGFIIFYLGEGYCTRLYYYVISMQSANFNVLDIFNQCLTALCLFVR